VSLQIFLFSPEQKPKRKKLHKRNIQKKFL
jgi:hypothetical protein